MDSIFLILAVLLALALSIGLFVGFFLGRRSKKSKKREYNFPRRREQHDKMLETKGPGSEPDRKKIPPLVGGSIELEEMKPGSPMGQKGVEPGTWIYTKSSGDEAGAEEVEKALAGLKQLHGQGAEAPQDYSQGDTVRCSVYAPKEVQRGAAFMIMAFAHLQEQAAEVEEVAKLFDDNLSKRAYKYLNKSVRQGSTVGFRLQLQGEIEGDAHRSFMWLGQPEHETFVVRLPEGYSAGKLIGTIYLSVDSVPAGQISFVVGVGSAAADKAPAETVARLYRYAFISYSSQNRQDVLKRTQMLKSIGQQFFQDVLSLQPGQLWEKGLYHHIDKCDVFYLFWSEAARESKWVRKEWEYALDRQQGDPLNPPAIIPIPLEGPPIPQPPGELSHLHFNDSMIYLITP